MCAFEGMLGAYFSQVGAVKAREVPEVLRAAVYGTFRVPLNVLVVAIQLLSPSSTGTFLTCTGLLAVAVGCFAAAHGQIKRRDAGGDGKLNEAAPLVSK